MPSEKDKAWRASGYDAQAEASGLRKAEFLLSDGTAIEPLYGPADAGETSVRLEADLGYPGEPPFTRGVQATMYRGRLWTMRQYAGFGTAAESNERYRMLLDAGGKGLSVAFDLPTQMGLDSTDPLSAGEVGKVGVAIDSIEDMHVLFDQIPLDKVSTSMTINATAPILLALYQVCAEERGISAAKLRGTIQNDVLKEYIARGTYIYPAAPSLAPGDGRLRVLQRRPAEVEHHLHQRLPHPRGRLRRGPGGRVHAGQWTRLREGRHRRRSGHQRLRRAARLLFQRPQRLP
jgi:methylmalonyl-CoA mutase N-terminal domain/subunit